MAELRDDAYRYVQIADLLKDRIAQGLYKAGTPIPSERELVDEFGVSPLTARKAVRILAADGLVVTLPSKGSFVARRDEAGG